ncbi:response regulator transcription factor [Alkalicoccus urumqiensis]|uniref:HTH luxR-type domain-containing protein n=1 Tax=Alkalicoccus urumqiensis TaxID=1548213 RepID=A0A2P6MLA9_ALKUR|nr:helix-turn-helix transcriptional regulator [Alkalicoccus urumqiensis]PRO67055.1 hypothetical protein C6I21_00365 [Alkalicoccus urumqiensis]
MPPKIYMMTETDTPAAVFPVAPPLQPELITGLEQLPDAPAVLLWQTPKASERVHTIPASLFQKHAIVMLPDHQDIMKHTACLHAPIKGLISWQTFQRWPGHFLAIVQSGYPLLEPEMSFYLARTLYESKRKNSRIVSVQLHPDKAPPDLTYIERLVLEMLVNGASTNDIAHSLYYSVKTVKRYITRLLRKTDSPDRTTMVVRAYREGWVKATV